MSHLPPLLLPIPSAKTGVPLGGVVRPGGRPLAAEDAAGVRRRTTAPSTAGVVRGGAERLSAMVLELRAPSASSTTLARRWQSAVRTSMTHKQQIYTRERASLDAEIVDAQAKAAAFVRQARTGGADALADSQTPNWDVAKEVNNRPTCARPAAARATCSSCWLCCP